MRRVDTHAASVFLAGSRALKIKRAVRFPFLDYSTPERRKAACEAELAINRAYAPDLYRGVVAITEEADGTLALDGAGKPIEWAVDMRRFDETRTLDAVAESGRIDEALADALGRAVAAAHARTPEVADFDFVAELRLIVEQNDAALADMPALFPVDAVRALTQASLQRLDTVADLLRARPARRTHGDLHLGNIALIDDKPVLFDAIEFDDALATGDVLYDLAFLLMDLIARGLDTTACSVFNRYLADNGNDSDLDALAALPLFLSARAAIRAKVTAARPSQDESTRQSARAYFELARRLIAPPPPQLVAVGGLSGTGKSTAARMLAPLIRPAPGAVLLRSDVERKRQFGAPETGRLPKQAYSREATADVYQALYDKARRVLAAGHSAVVDAVFADPDERAAIARIAGTHPFHGLFLVAALAIRVQRVGTREADASDADETVVRAQDAYDLGKLDWQQIDAGGTIAQTLDRARAELEI